jgi:hypothetical protein
MKKSIIKMYLAYINPVRCSRCGEKLVRSKDRANGISAQCATKNALHKEQQIKDTTPTWFFFSIPHSTKISAYYNTLEECRAAGGKRAGSRIWTGSVDAPVPVDWEYGVEKLLKPDALVIEVIHSS